MKTETYRPEEFVGEMDRITTLFNQRGDLEARRQLADDILKLRNTLSRALREVEGFERRTGTVQMATWIDDARDAVKETQS